MHRTKTLTFAFLTTAALVPFLAKGANRRQSYNELAASSDKVVLGTVGVRSSHWGEDSRIYTDVVVSPEVTIQGEEEGALVVRMLGGTVGDTQMSVSDGPDFPENDRVILFLKRNGGHFTVVGRSAGSIAVSSPDAADAVEGAFTHAERAANRRFASRRDLAGSLLTRDPIRGGGTTTTTSAVQQGCYNTDGAKWGTATATYKIGTSIPSTWPASIDAATATWNSVGLPFRLVNDSTSVNELSYVDLVAKYGNSYSNTYAVTTTWSSVSTRNISRATIEINTKWQWSTSGQASMADVQNILTHEFGHWFRLLDIYSPSTCSDVTMWGSASMGETKKRTLEQADIDGFTSLYGNGSGSTLSAPTLTSPSNGSTGVSTTPSLAWTAVSGATSYDVYFGTNASPGLAGTVTSTTFQPGTLTAGTAYFWRVVAKNASASATSSTFTFTVGGGTTQPSDVTLLTPANGATGVSRNPVMQWTPVSGATAYDLYVGTTPNPGRIGTTSSTSVTVSGFRAGGTYYWRVVARTSSATSTSAVWSFTTR